MNFSEELAMAGELELTDSELEIVSGGHRGWGRDDDFEPYWYPRIPPWWLYDNYDDDGGNDWGFSGRDRDDRRRRDR